MTVLVKCGNIGDFSAVLEDLEQSESRQRKAERGAPSQRDSVPGALPCAEDPDVALMLDFQNGSMVAFRQIVERWQRPLISFFYRSIHSLEEAEDLAQATFLRLHRAAPGYEPRARFAGYIFQIARRLLLNEIRRRRRKPSEALDPIDFDHHVADSAPSGNRELLTAFDEALTQLPENHRSALLLFVQQGLSYEEIAATLGAGIPAVKTWIFRGRQQLKTLLGDYLSKR